MTQFTRWLILLVGGTLVFGMLCFASGLLLGNYIWGEPHSVTAVALPAGAPAIPAVPTVTAPTLTAPTVTAPTAAAAAHAPAVSVQTGTAQITAPSVTVQTGASGAAAAAAPAEAPVAPAKAAVAAAPGAVAPAAAGGAPAPAAAAAAPAAGGIAVREVPDLVVGLPADVPSESPLRGPLVASATPAAAAAPPAAATGSTAPPQNAAASTTGTPASGGAGGGKDAPAAAAAAVAGTAAAPAAKAPPPPAAAKHAFAVRAGAYLDPAAAQRRAGLLQTHGYHPLILSSRQLDEGLTWYSVVLGQDSDMAMARREAAQFAGDQGYQPDIVSWPLAPPGGAGAAAGAAAPAAR